MHTSHLFGGGCKTIEAATKETEFPYKRCGQMWGVKTFGYKNSLSYIR